MSGGRGLSSPSCGRSGLCVAFRPKTDSAEIRQKDNDSLDEKIRRVIFKWQSLGVQE